MTAARERFLDRVRKALASDTQPGQRRDMPPRGQVGYQGAGPDAVQRFCDELTVAGAKAYRVPDLPSAIAVIGKLVAEAGAQRVLLGRGTVVDSLNLAGALSQSGATTVTARELMAGNGRDVSFQAQLGITGVFAAIAETGSLVVASGPDEPRSFSLLTPIHIAVVDRRQIVPDLFDFFDASLRPSNGLPSCVTLITGPSKTGDIELRLVTGVHGPGEVHVVIIENADS
jgi:L-lactate utilization protein LutC